MALDTTLLEQGQNLLLKQGLNILPEGRPQRSGRKQTQQVGPSQADQKRNLNPSWMALPVLFSSVIVPNAELLGVVFGFTNIT